jgi:SdrD B-like domain
MKRFKYLTLAALVAFAACDEGNDTPVAPPPTGTISGIVTIEGVGASGVTVTLSSGATAPTDGSGAYSFSGVAAGAYTVTISGFASDATFSSTAKAATISSAGQVATANFDGSYVRTSAILGSVAAGGSGLSGVAVAISGQSSASTTTDSNGQYSFSGLRAGSYTVSMTNPDASTYTFASSSESITLGVGSSQVVLFNGSLLATATISGRLFIDENDKDDTFSAGLEENLSVANVAITLEGGAVLDTMTVLSDANGLYSFSDLAAGTYRLTIDPAFANVPGMVTYGLASTSQIVTVTTGAIGTVNWPFDITTQTIKVDGWLGTDAVNPGVNPISGWTINLYDTQANATAGGAAGQLGSVATGADGQSMFRFLRTADVSPNTAVTDQIVFAQVAAAPTATHAISGETIIEIKYNAKDSVAMAPDTFDALYNSLVVKATAAEIDGDTGAGWRLEMRAEKDSAQGTRVSMNSAADGSATWTSTPAGNAVLGSDGAFPDTLWFRLSNSQPAANGHGWKQAPSAGTGTAAGRWLSYIWDGTVGPTDTIDVGTEEITYTDSDITIRVHREQDDSTDVPTFTAGDGVTQVALTNVQLYDATGTTSVRGPHTPAAATGLRTWANVATGVDYNVRARSTVTNKVFVLNDTSITITLDGSDQTYTDMTLAGSAGNSTFAIKSNNSVLRGTVLTDDGTKVKDLVVTMTPTADNIQGTPTMVDTTDAGGDYSFSKVIEGPYTLSVSDDPGTWEFFTTLTTASVPNSSGSANNTDAQDGTRDVQGSNVNLRTNFQPDAMDTEIHGVVVNDRDSDFNTLDPDEALSGVTINLIDDVDGDGAIATDGSEVTLSTTTTDVTGAYSFTALREGTYIVQAVSPAGATVLRALSGTGAVTSHIGVTTEAATGAAAPTGNCALADCTNQDNTNQVGTVDPPAQSDEFPRWSYTTGAAAADGGNIGGGGPNFANVATELTTSPANFVHLFASGTVNGQITAGAVGVSGVRVTITRCQTATTNGIVSPPAGFATGCDVKHGVPSPHIQNFDTDSNGDYTFSGLLEGIYQIDVAPATGGFTTNEGPDGIANGLDEIIMVAIQGNNDVETVPAYEIS